MATVLLFLRMSVHQNPVVNIKLIQCRNLRFPSKTMLDSSFFTFVLYRIHALYVILNLLRILMSNKNSISHNVRVV